MYIEIKYSIELAYLCLHNRTPMHTVLSNLVQFLVTVFNCFCNYGPRIYYVN